MTEFWKYFWQSKATQRRREGFFVILGNIVSALMELRVDKTNKLCFKSAFSKERFPLTVYWSRCYGALQNSYNYP